MNLNEQRDGLLESIHRDQEEVRVAVHDLTQAARETLQIADQIRAHPLTSLAAAFMVGLWLGRRAVRARPQIIIANEGGLYS